jgi:aurora kinase
MILQHKSEVQKINKEFEKQHSVTPSILLFSVSSQLCVSQHCKYYKVTMKTNKKPFTLRVASKTKIASTQKLKEQLFKELSLILNVLPTRQEFVKVMAVFEDKAQIYTLLEPVESSLAMVIKDGNKISEKQCQPMIKSLLSGLTFLHGLNPPVIHRNIRPENLFIVGTELKLFGFEHAASGEEFRNTICGSSEYIPPEMANKDGYDEKVDVWAIGMVMYEMLIGKNPLNLNSHSENFKLSHSIIDKVISDKCLTFDCEVSKDARQFLKVLLNPVPFKRPSAAETLELPFICPKITSKTDKDNSFTVNFEFLPSSKQIDESLDWSVTQSCIGKRFNGKESEDDGITGTELAKQDPYSSNPGKSKPKNSYDSNNQRRSENPFEILLERHHKIVT